MLVLVMMLNSGCLGLVDDVVDDIDDEIMDPVLDWLESEYPELDLPIRERTSPVLDSYDECELLLADLQASVYNEMMVTLDQESYWHWAGPSWRGGGIGIEDDMMMDGAPEAAGADTDSSSNADTSREGEYSETNNQEEGVDEADFLKTDGFHIYMLNGNLLVIMGVPEFGELTLESNMSIQGYPMQMMLDGDRLVVASNIYYWNLEPNDPLRALMSKEVTVSYPGQEEEYSYTYTRVQNLVKYTVIDISDRSEPEVEREIYV